MRENKGHEGNNIKKMVNLCHFSVLYVKTSLRNKGSQSLDWTLMVHFIFSLLEERVEWDGN